MCFTAVSAKVIYPWLQKHVWVVRNAEMSEILLRSMAAIVLRSRECSRKGRTEVEEVVEIALSVWLLLYLVYNAPGCSESFGVIK